MKSLPSFVLTIVVVCTLPASAEVTLNQSDDAVVLERALVRVEVMTRPVAIMRVPLKVEMLPFSLAPSHTKQGIWLKADRRREQDECLEPNVNRRPLEDARAHDMQFCIELDDAVGAAAIEEGLGNKETDFAMPRSHGEVLPRVV